MAAAGRQSGLLEDLQRALRPPLARRGHRLVCPLPPKGGHEFTAQKRLPGFRQACRANNKIHVGTSNNQYSFHLISPRHLNKNIRYIARNQAAANVPLGKSGATDVYS